ncbi:MAG: hypothetical protein PHW33_04740 [Candidatus Portnoybacteria bacterium]|nr:hypothetical protein [Candidatus Portnoybacteria bacterium]
MKIDMSFEFDEEDQEKTMDGLTEVIERAVEKTIDLDDGLKGKNTIMFVSSLLLIALKAANQVEVPIERIREIIEERETATAALSN